MSKKPSKNLVFNDAGGWTCDSFVFFRTWFESLKYIESIDDKFQLLNTICCYGFFGKEPDDNINSAIKMLFETIKYQIDLQNENFAYGARGGKASGESRRKKKEENVPEAEGRFAHYVNKNILSDE